LLLFFEYLNLKSHLDAVSNDVSCEVALFLDRSVAPICYISLLSELKKRTIITNELAPKGLNLQRQGNALSETKKGKLSPERAKS